MPMSSPVSADDAVRIFVAQLAQQQGYRFDTTIGRYRDKQTGRLVSEQAVISSVERFNNSVIQSNVDNLTNRLIDGRITLAQWQQGMSQELKDGWLVNAMAGRGGKNAMTPADYGRVGGRLRFEYQQLDRFAEEIKAGTLTAAQIKYRAGLYANGPRSGYYDGKTAAMRSAGFIAEQRFLGDTDHCDVCIDLANQGRQPIGTLPEPGTRCLGRHNCGCTKVYYNEFE